MDALNLSVMTVAELTATYNQLTGKSLKKFDTKTQGVARVQKVLDDQVAASPSPSVEARKALVGEAVPVGRVKKTVTKITSADGTVTTKTVKTTASSEIRRLILDGLGNSEIWKIVQPQFNLGDAKKSYPAWYRRDMNKKG